MEKTEPKEKWIAEFDNLWEGLTFDLGFRMLDPTLFKKFIRRLLDEQRRDIIEEIGASLTGTTLVFNGEQMLGIGIEKWKALKEKIKGR